MSYIPKTGEVYSGAIGIDLGTTYSCVGVWQNERVEIIANDQGNRTTPSYVAFKDMERLIGDNAKNQAAINPTNTVFDAKRLIGRKFKDSVVQADMKHWPFKVITNGDDKPVIQVQFRGESKTFLPEEISAMVLVKMKETAEYHLKKQVKKAVVTVPAYFNDSQRQTTKDAGEIAGLEVLRILNEPTAAAIAYGMDNKDGKECNVLIFDLGGGTFDVSLISVKNGAFDVKATSGDTHLGGGDFDNRLVSHLAEEFKRKNNGRDLSANQRAMYRLRTSSERAKRTLSSAEQATIDIDALFDNIDFQTTITRGRFEELCCDLFQQTIPLTERVLQDAMMDKHEVDEVLLVGGSTRIPKVMQLVHLFFNGKELNGSINPDEAVAYGAAVQAFMLTGGKSKHTNDLRVLDVTPLGLGCRVKDGSVSTVIKRNTKIPVTESHDFTTSEDNQTSVFCTVFEGDAKMAVDCELLGSYELTGIPPAPRGTPKITVTFSIDADGIIKASAKDRKTGNMNSVTLTNYMGRPSKHEIEHMRREEEQYEANERKQRERITDNSRICSEIQSTIKDEAAGRKRVEVLETAWCALVEPCFRTRLGIIEDASKERDELDRQMRFELDKIRFQEQNELLEKEKKALRDNTARVDLKSYALAKQEEIRKSTATSHLDEHTIQKITEATERVLKFLKENSDATATECEEHLRHLQSICEPLGALNLRSCDCSEDFEFLSK